VTKKVIRSLITATATGTFLMGSNPLPSSMAAESTRIKIATALHSEKGCSESAKTFKVFIPKAKQLDHNYQGVLGGIERIYGEANGTRGDSNYAFTDHGTSLTFSLFAKGGGTNFVPKGAIPKLAPKGGNAKSAPTGGTAKSVQKGGSRKSEQNGKATSWCQGASVASIAVEIYAHYKRNQN
jgi:hypothetical protein